MNKSNEYENDEMHKESSFFTLEEEHPCFREPLEAGVRLSRAVKPGRVEVEWVLLWVVVQQPFQRSRVKGEVRGGHRHCLLRVLVVAAMRRCWDWGEGPHGIASEGEDCIAVVAFEGEKGYIAAVESEGEHLSCNHHQERLLL